ncbi:AcrB/AcrD/AcrF family protein [Kosakonia oryziphila]|uniref:AcrB/AcrD/AcrF family protein n=1 Tax=Kosakonia oryziphila TaxID=1005667 RepID=A0A1C4BIN3_9ENTR|nr:AcrB/AcrD/AcrF family protein [Kosakonia oryziphila]
MAVYDRPTLIEGFIVVVLVCTLFLFHFRSALVAIVSLPLGILGALSVITENGSQIALGDLADIVVTEGPTMLKGKNAHLSNWIHVNLRGRDLKSAIEEMQQRVAQQVKLPQGGLLSWSGQFEYLERATA